ncbi:hypothetical protein AGMMS50249_4110 [candidate division SR1 bacterium]|nr:hypothetical protein AGMMS50249_4110 [candidate division SR1 bacterium]
MIFGELDTMRQKSYTEAKYCYGLLGKNEYNKGLLGEKLIFCDGLCVCYLYDNCRIISDTRHTRFHKNGMKSPYG